MPADPLWATEPAYLAKAIPSYLYVQYNDDDDLQAFVQAYNELAQEIITWLNTAAVSYTHLTLPTNREV